MKLFQIEEPEGASLDANAPGVAVGIDLSPEAGGAVAVAVAGNAEILPDADGARRLAAPGLLGAGRRFDAAALGALLLELRGRAEKQLARPVTHAVIAAAPLGGEARGVIEGAAQAAGLALLRILDRETAASLAKGAARDEAAVLGAAIAAEDLAPPAA